MSTYTGTAALVRLALRRDRILLPLGVVGLVALAAGSAKATLDLYTDPTAAVTAVQAINDSPALRALYGPVADPSNPDSAAIFKTLVMGAIFIALFAYALVRRHTRTEEEAGRTELLSAGVLGRRATLTAAVVVASAAVLLTAVVTTLGLIGSGLGAAGSVAFGVAWALVGLTFVGITAVAAQLTEGARGCAGIVLGVLGLSYLLRAVGDTSSSLSWLTWLSPIGWAEKVQAFGADRLWVGLIGLVVTVLLVGVAFGLLHRRDIGAGLLPARPGPASAAASLSSPWALAWRLQRGTLLAWALGYLLLGLVLGGVATSVGSFVDSPDVEDMLRQMGGDSANLTDVFLSTELHFLAVGAAAYGISAALRLRSEETALHSEQLLATTVSRRALLSSHSVIALAGSALLMALLGLAMAVSFGSQSSQGVASAIGHLMPAALSVVPSVWVCVGLALVLFGSMPRWVLVAWGLLTAFLVLGEFGGLIGLPDAVIGVSPFAHGSIVPGAALQGTPLVVLLAIAAVLVAASLAGFRRRDVTS